MITLYQFPTGFSLPTSVSQFCTKLEAYFRLTDREYQVEIGDPRKSPNKKMPYVAWPDGRITAESAEIIAELENKGPALDQDLSAADREAGEAYTAHAEGPIYFACLYSRFVDPNGWKHQKVTIKKMVPGVVAPIVGPIIRRAEKKLCANNGFSNREDYAKAISAITTLSDALGDKPFMLGDDIQIVDCSVWANLMHVAYTLSDNPARHAVRSDVLLMAYINRIAVAVDWKLPALH